MDLRRVSSARIEEHGWVAVPRSQAKLLAEREDPQESTAMKVEDISLPNSELVQAVTRYARENLPEETLNHSMRVFYYGQAIATQHFPDWSYSHETYLLTCLLHDIGTTDHNLAATQLSFEFYGALLAFNLLKDHEAPRSQSESVCEAIIRHQDLGETGMITTIGALTHFATLLDNAGANPELVHKETIENVVREYPRNGWTACFAATVKQEIMLKPWCHSTAIDGFEDKIRGNKLMEPYD
ncbi:hypothetical protein LTR66_011297 [Elasticomyces elasticus]|nr:hypothetical protein LTR66_011297 [Elasticomyces elasticus]